MPLLASTDFLMLSMRRRRIEQPRRGDDMDQRFWTDCAGGIEPLTRDMLATIRQHAALILPIVAQGGLAGVVHGELGPAMHHACQLLGWDGHSPVFKPTPWAVVGLACTLREMGDQAGCDFMLSGAPGRIAVFFADDARMFQYDPSGAIGRAAG